MNEAVKLAEKKMRKPLFLRVPLQDKILLSRHLAIALKSGMSLVDSVRLIRGQTRSASLKVILDDVAENITRGIFLSKGLEKYENIFGALFVSIIKIAETSGTLPENLNYLAGELKKKYELRKRVRGAMIYPAIILAMTVLIATGMILFVFPKILPVFESLNVELPFTTRMLMAFSQFISAYGLWLLAGLIVLFFILRLFFRTAAVKFFSHRLIIGVPIFRRAVLAFNIANVTRTLAILLRSGVQIVDAVKITARSTPNLAYRRELELASEEVRRGVFFSRHLQMEKRYFPEIMANMIEVGENTGNLVDNLFYLAEYYEGELDDFVKNLSGILEPILLLFMGGIVGFIALSFITPIYQLTKGF